MSFAIAVYPHDMQVLIHFVAAFGKQHSGLNELRNGFLRICAVHVPCTFDLLFESVFHLIASFIRGEDFFGFAAVFTPWEAVSLGSPYVGRIWNLNHRYSSFYILSVFTSSSRGILRYLHTALTSFTGHSSVCSDMRRVKVARPMPMCAAISAPLTRWMDMYSSTSPFMGSRFTAENLSSRVLGIFRKPPFTYYFSHRRTAACLRTRDLLRTGEQPVEIWARN
nr:MAG TPA: hypothetical protein [Caudoviricetes sp.]